MRLRGRGHKKAARRRGFESGVEPLHNQRAGTARSTLVNLLFEEGEEVGLGDAFLGHRVAFAQREGVAGLFDGVEVDGHAPRGADLVLAAVAFTDRTGLVVEDGVAALEFFCRGPGRVA